MTSKNNKKTVTNTTTGTTAKVVLLISAITFIVGVFLPWEVIGNKGYNIFDIFGTANSVGSSVGVNGIIIEPIAVMCLVVLTAILTAISLATKNKKVGKAGGVFGIIAGLSTIGFSLIRGLLPTLHFNGYGANIGGFGIYVSLVASIVLFISAIASLSKSKQ